MTRYAALLRGVNVGRAKRIAMAELRELLAGLGFTGVRTHLQSGNAVFAAPQQPETGLARRIEHALAEQAGLDTRCLVRDAAALRAVVAANPLGSVAADGSKLLALFLSDAPAPDAAAGHDPRELDPARVRLGEKVIYQYCPGGVLAAPPVAAFVERHWHVAVTARNWNTVTKLAGMLPR
jgi:uncharacterized protein (DUF1697 family)